MRGENARRITPSRSADVARKVPKGSMASAQTRRRHFFTSSAQTRFFLLTTFTLTLPHIPHSDALFLTQSPTSFFSLLAAHHPLLTTHCIAHAPRLASHLDTSLTLCVHFPHQIPLAHKLSLDRGTQCDSFVSCNSTSAGRPPAMLDLRGVPWTPS